MNFKVIEIGCGRDRRINQREIRYQGPSVNDALDAYKTPIQLPYGDKRFYQGRRRLYDYELPKREESKK